MKGDTALILGIVILILMFSGEPNLMDALISRLM